MADIEIRMTGGEGADGMPLDMTGPKARPDGESRVEAKKKAREDASDLNANLKTLGKDLADWAGLSKVAAISERIRETFDNVARVVNSIRPPAGKPAGSDSLPEIRPVTTKPAAPSASPPTAGGKPVEEWPFRALPITTKPASAPASPTASTPATPPVTTVPAASREAAKAATTAAGTEGAAAGLARLGAVAGPAAIAIGGLAAGVYAVKSAFSALASEVQKLKEYSAPVAAAEARNEFRQEMATIRRGEEIGPQLGKFASDMGRVNEKATEIWTKMLKVLLQMYEAVRPVVDLLVKLMTLVSSGIEITESSIAMVIEQLKGKFADRGVIIKEAGEIARAMVSAAVAMKDAEDPGRIEDPILQSLLDKWNAGGSSSPRDRSPSSPGLPPINIPPGLRSLGVEGF